MSVILLPNGATVKQYETEQRRVIFLPPRTLRNSLRRKTWPSVGRCGAAPFGVDFECS